MQHTRLIAGAWALAAGIALIAGARVEGHGHGTSMDQNPTAMDRSQLAALRGASARFHRVEAALAEGYTPFGGCFSDPAGTGAMGYHYVNNDMVDDPAIDPLRPELLVYEQRPNGELRLVAVEWITFVSAWHGAGNSAPPALFGRDFEVNPTLLAEPFYLLHAWIWKHNPVGLLADWNPEVSCR